MTATPALDSLILNRVFAAPIQKVFDAWTKAEILAMWFGPEGFEVLTAECDVSVGGKYEITIQSPDKNTIKHFGEYIEVDSPHNLVFTWILQNQECAGSENQQATTLVSLLFMETDEGTSLTLTHEQLPDQAAYNGHQFGWQSSLDSLFSHLIKGEI